MSRELISILLTKDELQLATGCIYLIAQMDNGEDPESEKQAKELLEKFTRILKEHS